jgi:hypothetical protein
MNTEWPTADSRPVSRGGASTVELDDNVAVYDEVGQLLILLNSSAASVWALCDGSTTAGSMVEALAATHPDHAEVIREDVWQTLRKLVELGLVSDASDPDETVAPGVVGS